MASNTMRASEYGILSPPNHSEMKTTRLERAIEKGSPFLFYFQTKMLIHFFGLSVSSLRRRLVAAPEEEHIFWWIESKPF